MNGPGVQHPRQMVFIFAPIFEFSASSTSTSLSPRPVGILGAAGLSTVIGSSDIQIECCRDFGRLAPRLHRLSRPNPTWHPGSQRGSLPNVILSQAPPFDRQLLRRCRRSGDILFQIISCPPLYRRLVPTALAFAWREKLTGAASGIDAIERRIASYEGRRILVLMEISRNARLARDLDAASSPVIDGEFSETAE